MLKAVRQSDKITVYAAHVDRGAEIYHCPECQGVVILNKAVVKLVDYFRHKTRCTCVAAGESKGHMQIKLDIVNYLQRTWGNQLTVLEVEYRLNADLRSDIYLETVRGSKIAIEVQVSPLTTAELHRRTGLYRVAGVYVLWVLPFNFKRFYQYWTAYELAVSNYLGEPRYLLRDSVRFKAYELSIARLTYNYLTFWDYTHQNSNGFYVLKLADAYGADSEYYNERGQQEYFEGKRLKTTKAISARKNVSFNQFEPMQRSEFKPGSSYATPARRVMMFKDPKK